MGSAKTFAVIIVALRFPRIGGRIMNIIIVLLTHARWYKSTDRCGTRPLILYKGCGYARLDLVMHFLTTHTVDLLLSLSKASK